jgi:hypothetical protein
MNIKDSHLSHYAFLIVGMALLGVFFVLFKYNTSIQIFIGLLGCIFYTFWGIFHHALEDRVTELVVFEYVLFSLVAFLLMTLFVTI